MYNTIEVNNIFDKYVSYNMNRNTWSLITCDLLDYINVTEDVICGLKKTVSERFINTMLYKSPCNVPIEYTNELYSEVYLHDVVKISFDDINIKAIIKNWSNDQLCLSLYENKLYYIYYNLYDKLEGYRDSRTFRLIKEWINYLYFTKRKSLRNQVNNTIWGIYNEILFNINIVSFNNNIMYIQLDEWENNKEFITNIFNSITSTLDIHINDILILPDNNIVDVGERNKKRKQ